MKQKQICCVLLQSKGDNSEIIIIFQALINHLKLQSHGSIYSCTMAPPVTQQIISSMSIIMGADGTNEGKDMKMCKILFKFVFNCHTEV